MHGISRRVFLKGGSAAVVVAGVLSAVPGLPALVSVTETQGPADATSAGAGEAEAQSAVMMEYPVIAHVKDLASGEISLFSGTEEVTVLDRALAARLLGALH